jgi:hypothetical protein
LTLQGNLDTLSISHVLGVLAAADKTGCLRVRSDHGHAALWLRDGALTAATTDRVPGGPFDEVVSDLLRYEDGSFVFDPDDGAPEGAEPGPIEDLLQDGRRLLAEWEELLADVPSLDHRVALSADLGDEPVTITADQWPTLTAVGDGCTVRDLAVSLRLTELGVLRVLNDLRSLGLASIEAPQPAHRRKSTTTRLA